MRTQKISIVRKLKLKTGAQTSSLFKCKLIHLPLRLYSIATLNLAENISCYVKTNLRSEKFRWKSDVRTHPTYTCDVHIFSKEIPPYPQVLKMLIPVGIRYQLSTLSDGHSSLESVKFSILHSEENTDKSLWTLNFMNFLGIENINNFPVSINHFIDTRCTHLKFALDFLQVFFR